MIFSSLSVEATTTPGLDILSIPGKRANLNNPIGLRIKSGCFGVEYGFNALE